MKNQTNYVWVNEEPVKYIAPNDSGVVPIRWVFKKGSNSVYVTAENIEGEEGSTEATIKEGTWDKPKQIKVHYSWKSKQGETKSPVFSYEEPIGFKEDLSGFEDINPSDEEVKEIISQFYKQIKTSLDNRTLEGSGINAKKLNALMKSAFKVDGYTEAVFNSDTYSVKVHVKPEELRFKRGKKTLFVYTPKGRIMEAGPDSRNDGTMVYSFFMESMSLAKKDGKWLFYILSSIN